jgi:hypothetical protein
MTDDDTLEELRRNLIEHHEVMVANFRTLGAVLALMLVLQTIGIVGSYLWR